MPGKLAEGQRCLLLYSYSGPDGEEKRDWFKINLTSKPGDYATAKTRLAQQIGRNPKTAGRKIIKIIHVYNF